MREVCRRGIVGLTINAARPYNPVRPARPRVSPQSTNTPRTNKLLLVLSSWLLFAPALIGVGLLTVRPCGVAQLSSSNVFTAFWLGWSLALAGLQLYHLFLPVTALTAALVLAIGLFGILLGPRQLRAVLIPLTAQRIALAVLAILLVLWVAARACGATLVYDSGLYHLTNIRWINHFPLVPGIGNLHVRLGFSNTYFLYPALLNFGPWTNVAHHLPNGLLLSAFLVQSLCSAARLLRRQAGPALPDICRILLLGPAVNEAMRNQICSPSPDLPVFLLGAVAGCTLLDLLCNALSDGERRLSFLTLCAVSLIGIAIKLSFAVLGASYLLLGTYAVLRHSTRASRPRLLLAFLLLSLFIVAPWVMREVVMTGYVGFPASFISFAVDWRVELSVAHEYVGWIRSWARTPFVAPEKVLADWSWLGPWLKRMTEKTLLYDMYVPLTGALGAGALWWLAGRWRRASARGTRAAWLVVAAAVLHLVYWFVSAPDVRFAGAGFWVAAVVVTALFVERVAGGAQPTRALLSFVITGGLVGLALAGSGPILPRPDWLRLSPLPPPQVTTWATDSGLTLYVPTSGDQCFDAPLPCTPLPRKHLRLRREDDLGAGFTTAPAGGAGNQALHILHLQDGTPAHGRER